MNHCQNSTNKLFLRPFLNEEGRKVYFLEQEEVDNAIAASCLPVIETEDLSQKKEGTRVALLLTRDQSPFSGKDAYSMPETLIDSLRLFGLEPVFMVYEKIEEQLKRKGLKGVLLPGGDFALPEEWCLLHAVHPKNKLRMRAYLACLEAAKANHWPLLGICAGMQMLGGFCGAKITRVNNHRGVVKEFAHNIHISKDSLLHQITGLEQTQVNSNHSEAISREHLGDCILSAVADDNTVEAIEIKNPWTSFVVGIQSHPEYFVKKGDEFAVNLFKSFAEACKNV